MKNKFAPKLDNLILESAKADPNFDTTVDKTFINIILSQPNDKSAKFELLNAFYISPNIYRNIADQNKGKSAKVEKPVFEETKLPVKDIIPKKTEENKDPKPQGGKVLFILSLFILTLKFS